MYLTLPFWLSPRWCKHNWNHVYCVLYKLRSVRNIGTCYPGQGWFVKNLSAASQVHLTNPAEAWVACPVLYTDLNLFYSIHFPFFAGVPPCTVPSSIVHCNQNEDGHQTIKSPSMRSRCAAAKHSLQFMPPDWWNWQIRLTKSVSMGSFQYRGQLSGEFCIHVNNVTVFQARIGTDFRSVRIRFSYVVLKIN